MNTIEWLNSYEGQFAGLGTSMAWLFCALAFTAAGKRIGPTMVNATRIVVAIALLSVTHRLINGHWIPDVQFKHVAYLSLSGIVGLAIGDQALLVAFVDVGPRMALLIMTTSPLFATMFGWLFLGESPHGMAWIGIFLAVGGVAWVVAERPSPKTFGAGKHRARGVLLSLVGSICQAGGLLLSKQGMGHGWSLPEEHINPQAATLVRMVFAAAGMLPIIAYHTMQRRRKTERARRRPTPIILAGFGFMAIGAFCGPYMGVWLSLVAANNLEVGVAQTLCSLAPVLILPVVHFIFKEPVSLRAVAGALLAVTGTSLLFYQA